MELPRDFPTTLVFLDTETTGTRHSRPRIVELSMISVHKDMLLDELLRAGTGGSFRVSNKLSLCFNPKHPFEGPHVSNINGLHNDVLEHQSPFDLNACYVVRAFLERLEPPTCLVAYNGRRFDYPLLKTEFLKNNVTLPDMYCVDLLEAVTELDYIDRHNSPRFPDVSVLRHPDETPPVKEPTDSGQSYIQRNRMQGVKRKLFSTPVPMVYSARDVKRARSAASSSRQVNLLGATHPSRDCGESSEMDDDVLLNCVTRIEKENGIDQDCHWSDEEEDATLLEEAYQAETQLYGRKDDVTPPSCARDVTPRETTGPCVPRAESPGRYRLQSVYERCMQRAAEDLHTAEGDVRCMLAIYKARASRLLPWTARHMEPLQAVQPMYQQHTARKT